MTRRRTTALAALVLLVATALAGCASLPSSGPIEASTNTGTGDQPGPFDIDPLGPQRGASPDEVVSGFLDAMLETPIRQNVAREFLARQVRDSWQPTRTVTYEGHSLPHGTSTVSLTLSGADQLDSRGAWDGPVDPDDGDQVSLSFPMVKQDGEWRIARPPDALIVPETWFEERFRQVSLYFFDPTGTVLVPDPVFVPTGRQLASSLIQGLLAGPPRQLTDFSMNLVPANLHVALSVPVSRTTRIADVQLTGGAGAASMPAPQDAGRLVAQLAWTLRQDPEIEGMRISIDGEPVRVDGRTQFPVAGETYAPYVNGSSTLLYGLLGGRMVGGSAQNLDPVGGPFGVGDLGLRDVVPDLRADRAAGVSADGTALVEGPVGSGQGTAATVLSGASDLQTPAWDFSGRVWTVDDRPGGAVVYHVDPGQPAQTLQVNGVSGRDVKRLLVSRDGSRLVAVVHRGPHDDVIVVSRILTSPQGRVIRALNGRTISEEGAGDAESIRDIAWRSPTSIVVLHPVGPALYQVRTATVDGAPSGQDTVTLTLAGDFTGLVGSPQSDQSVYAVGKGRLVDLAGPRAGSVDVDPDVTSLTYPG